MPAPAGGSDPAGAAPGLCPALPLRPHLPGAGGRGSGARPLLRLLQESPARRRSRRAGTAAARPRRQPQPPRPSPGPGSGEGPARRHHRPRGGRSVNSNPATRPGHRHAAGAGALGQAEAGRPPSWLRAVGGRRWRGRAAGESRPGRSCWRRRPCWPRHLLSAARLPLRRLAGPGKRGEPPPGCLSVPGGVAQAV